VIPLSKKRLKYLYSIQEIRYVTSLAWDPLSQRLFATDQHNNRILSYCCKTKTLLSSFGERGTNTGQFRFPIGVLVDAQRNRLIVADNFRIQIFRLSDYYPLQQIKIESYPSHLALHYESGDFFVLLSSPHKIVIFANCDDTYAKKYEFGSKGEKDGELQGPYFLAVQSCGFLFVGDYTRVQRFSGSGVHQCTLLKPKDVVDWFPSGLAIDGDDKLIACYGSQHPTKSGRAARLYLYSPSGDLLCGYACCNIFTDWDTSTVLISPSCLAIKLYSREKKAEEVQVFEFVDD
jgi:hypothetical protein